MTRALVRGIAMTGLIVLFSLQGAAAVAQDDAPVSDEQEHGDLPPVQQLATDWLATYEMRTAQLAREQGAAAAREWKSAGMVSSRISYFLQRSRQLEESTFGRYQEIARELGLNVDSILAAAPERKAQLFLTTYEKEWVALRTAAEEAAWAANTKIVEGDSSRALAASAAEAEMAAFTGSPDNIKQARRWKQRESDLGPLQRRQVEMILYKAANHPGTAPELVKRRIEAETAQTQDLYGFQFFLPDGSDVEVAAIDSALEASRDLEERLRWWRASKEIGPWLKGGLTRLVYLRNASVQELGYDDFFQYMVSEYGITVEELLEIADRFNRELRPLYRELHTWVRYELADRYGAQVPELLPAHWLPNRWGQDLTVLVTPEGLDLDAALADREPEYLVKAAEDFYVSLGFDALPQTFWERSSLYPLPPNAGYKKNNHASAWHIDLEQDVRCLMSVTPTAGYWETTHHELGHIYYDLAYANPNVPHLLRRGANRAFHEAVGSLLGLASMHQPFLVERGIIQSTAEVDTVQKLLQEALNTVWFIPWSAGVMTHYEAELYGEPLSVRRMNRRWWELKETYQGIEPPMPRSEVYCDAVTKTHINNDPAGYYDYALAYVLLYQLHDHISREILEQNPHATNYYGKQKVGAFLRELLEPGATRDWRELLDETIGEQISATAMLDYFAPLHEWLREQNEGREHTLPALGGVE